MRGTRRSAQRSARGSEHSPPGSQAQITGRSDRILPEIAVRAVRGRENLAIDNRTPSSARASHGIPHADLIDLYAKALTVEPILMCSYSAGRLWIVLLARLP